MNKLQNGSFMALAAPLFLLCFFVFIFLIDFGRTATAQIRAGVLAEVTLKSSLNLKKQALEKVAARYEELGDFIQSVSIEGFSLVEGAEADFVNQSQVLSRSLSGYKGRIKAVIKVVADANGISREQVHVLNEEASTLDLETLPIKGLLADGSFVNLEDAWVRRLWQGVEVGHDQMFLSQHKVTLPIYLMGGKVDGWLAEGAASGGLRWDRNEKDGSILSKGNGGFPKSWGDVLDGSAYNPFRYPNYYVEFQ